MAITNCLSEHQLSHTGLGAGGGRKATVSSVAVSLPGQSRLWGQLAAPEWSGIRKLARQSHSRLLRIRFETCEKESVTTTLSPSPSGPGRFY